jgi:hypothetical protein
METSLSGRLQFATEDEAVEHFHRQGWTDGLPITLPTPDRVSEMLESIHMVGEEVIGVIPERNRVITAEKAATAAVMAGCLPAYMPVVLAALQGILHPQFGVHGPTASTGGAGILLIVNGPIIQQLGFNHGKRLMSNTQRANVTIGRAVTLLMQNAGGTAQFDQTTVGHPGKLSFCIAEAEIEEWLPLHVERGFNREDSTVTVFAAEGPNQINNHVAGTPEGLLLSIADRMTSLATFHMQRETQCVLVICPEHLKVFKDHGWNKRMVQDYLYEHAKRPKSDFYRYGLQLDPPTEAEEKQWKRAIPTPEDILLVSAGGPAGGFSALIPGWGSIHQTRAVTQKITSSGFT